MRPTQLAPCEKLRTANFARLSRSRVELVARMPLVPGFNDDDENVVATAEFLHQHGHTSLHLLGYHRLGEAKKARLGSPLEPFEHASVEVHELKEFASRFEDHGINVEIYD